MAGKKQVEQSSDLSKEYVEDSSDAESDHDNESQKLPSGSDRVSNGRNRVEIADDKAKPSSSAEDSQTEEDSETDSESGRDSPGSGVVEDAIESDSQSRTNKRPHEQNGDNDQQQQKKLKATPSSTTRIPVKAFEPPTGFAVSQAPPTKALANSQQLFSNPDAKQIWHITAPADLDITSIKQLDLAAAVNGEPINADDGMKYTMHSSRDAAEVLLLPDASSQYKRSKAMIAKSFRLQRSVTGINVHRPTSGSLSPDSVSAASFTAQHAGQRKDPRQQPDGLRVRYTPFGVYESLSSKSPAKRKKKRMEAIPSETQSESTTHEAKKQPAKHPDLGLNSSTELENNDTAVVDGAVRKKEKKSEVQEEDPLIERRKKKKKKSSIE